MNRLVNVRLRWNPKVALSAGSSCPLALAGGGGRGGLETSPIWPNVAYVALYDRRILLSNSQACIQTYVYI